MSMQKRLVSTSKGKAKQLETKMLEQETRKMEEKLAELKKFTEIQKQKRQQEKKMNESGSRWKAASISNNAPLKSYAQKILEEQKEVFKKYGVNTKKIMGPKSFKPIVDTIKPPKNPQTETMMALTANVRSQDSENNRDDGNQPPQTQVLLQTKLGKAVFEVEVNIQHSKTVSEFLCDIFLDQYISVFDAAGVTDLEQLRNVKKSDLQSLGLSAGHQIKFINNLKKHFEAIDQADESSKNKTQTNPPSDSAAKTTKTEGAFKMTQPDRSQSEQKQQQQENGEDESYDMEQIDIMTENTEGVNLGEGQYDEERNKREFEEALMAYRGVVSWVEELAIQTQTEVLPAAVSKTAISKVCFSCYRAIKSEPIQVFGKDFCRDICREDYECSITEICPKCEKSFIKFSGVCYEGVRYCSEACAPDDRVEMEALFIQWRLEELRQQKLVSGGNSTGRQGADESHTFQDSLDANE